jgi:hypothetical protein
VSCPTYVAPPGYQLGAGPTGPVDCTAWAASRAIAHATCGEKVPTGRTIRRHSDEPIPDPASPGLNLYQVADVAREVFGVYLDVRTGWRALSWGEYEARRKGGAAAVLQVSYAPIADSLYDAGRGFRGGHALFESRHDTLDSLADGRARNVYDRTAAGVRLYPRGLMRRAAGQLVIGTDARGRPRRVGDGKVWCAFTLDAIPEYRARIPGPKRRRQWRKFRMFHIRDGRINPDDPYEVGMTRGFDAQCSIPRAFLHPDGRLQFLVQLLAGSRGPQTGPDGTTIPGRWINARWASPVGLLEPRIFSGFTMAADPDDDLEADDPQLPVPDVRSDPYPVHADDPVGGDDD